jgi:sec-independent protein translocase protein TatA
MNTCLAIMGLGGGELVMVLAAVLILFGAKRIPEFAKGLGQGIKEFKKASSGLTNEFHNAINEEQRAGTPREPLPPAEAVRLATVEESANGNGSIAHGVTIT